MEVGDLDQWTSAAATIAKMQIDWLTGMDDLVGLGCSRRSLAELEAEVGPLAAMWRCCSRIAPTDSVMPSEPRFAAVRAS